MKKMDRFFYMNAIEYQAGKRVYKQFGINRLELNMLMGLSAYLMLLGKKAVSRKQFTDWIGANYKMEKKCWNYLFGLVEKGCLYRLAWRGTHGNSLGLSEYGVRVLEYFENQMNLIESADRVKRSKLTYKDLSFNTDNLPKGYILMQKGRDN